MQLPQPLPVAPAVDPRRKLVFQLADRENLFVLAMPGGRCRQVFPLGHQPGAIATPPVLLGDCLLVAVNRGAGDSSLQVLKIESAGPAASPPAAAIGADDPDERACGCGPFDQRRPRAVGHRRRRDPRPANCTPGAREPLREASGAHLEGGPGLVRFPLLHGDRCFIAGEQLAGFDIRPSDKQLAPAWADPSQGPAAETPLAIGPTIFHVRHAAAMPGLVVSAVNADKGDLDWQTCLAAPLAAEPLLDAAPGQDHAGDRRRWRISLGAPVTWLPRPPPSRRRPGRRRGCAGP